MMDIFPTHYGFPYRINVDNIEISLTRDSKHYCTQTLNYKTFH